MKERNAPAHGGYLKGFSCPASLSADLIHSLHTVFFNKTRGPVIQATLYFVLFYYFRRPSFAREDPFCRSYTKHTHTHISTYLYRKLSIMKVREKMPYPLLISYIRKAKQKEIRSHLSSRFSPPSPSLFQHSSHRPETSTTIFSADSHVLPTCRISAPLPTFTRVVRMAGFTRGPWIRAENATVDLEEGEEARMEEKREERWVEKESRERTAVIKDDTRASYLVYI